MEINAIVIHPMDNVAVVLKELKAGEEVLGLKQKLKAREKIPRNHKIALKEIRAGEKVIKYGESIGIALKDLQPGEWVHTHNLKAEED